MEIKTTTSDRSRKGDHVSKVHVTVPTIPGNHEVAPVVTALQGVFSDAKVERNGYWTEAGCTVTWKKESKYKKDAPSSAMMLGELTLKYGSLDKRVGEVVAKALERVALYQQAECIVKNANNVGSHLAKDAMNRAVKNIDFNTRREALYAELEAEAKARIQDVIVEEGDEWTYDNGEVILSEVRELVTGQILDFIKHDMQVVKGNGFNVYSDKVFTDSEERVSLLAIVLEGRKASEEINDANNGNQRPGERGEETPNS